MWNVGFSNSVQSLVMVPLVLYQAEQILCGQIAVILFRRWARDEWMPKDVVSDTETSMDGEHENQAAEMETDHSKSEKTETAV